MARYRSVEELIISLGIDINDENAQNSIQAVEAALQNLGEVFNRELGFNIDTSNLQSVLEIINRLDARINSTIDSLNRISNLSVNFSSGQGVVSTYQTNLTNMIDTLNSAGVGEIIEPEPLVYNVSHRQGGSYVLNEIIDQLKEIEKLNKKMLQSEPGSEPYQYYNQSISEANNRLQRFIETNAEGAVKTDELSEAMRRFQFEINRQNQEIGAKQAYQDRIKLEKEYTSYLKEESKIIKQIDSEESKLTSNYEKERLNNVKQLVSEYTRLYSAKMQMEATPDSEFNPQLDVVNSSLNDVIQNLNKYQIEIDETGKISTDSFNSSAIDINENSEAYKELINYANKYNQTIDENRAKAQKTSYDTEVKNYIKDLNELYRAKSLLQKLEFAKGNSSELIEQRNIVNNLANSIDNKYTPAIKENSTATRVAEENTAKLSREYKSLQNGLNRTGTLFGGLSKKIITVAENTLSYGIAWNVLSSGDQAISATIQKVRELDTTMTEIQMVTGQTDNQVRELIGTYSEMARQLGSTTEEVAKGSVEWLRQGKTVEETNKLLTASTMLSKVGMIEATEATELMTAALNGFKLSADEALGVVDKLAAVDLAYATSSEEIAVALQYVASSAGMANVSLDKMIGLITVVSQTTRLSAEQIGQSFKTIIARMQNIKVGKFVDDETGEALNDVEKVLNNIGISLRDSATEWRSLEDVIDEVGRKWETFNDIEKSAITTALAGTRQRD